MMPPLGTAIALAIAWLVLPLALHAVSTARTLRSRGEQSWVQFLSRQQWYVFLAVFVDAPVILTLRLERAWPAHAAEWAWGLAIAVGATRLVAISRASRVVERQLRGFEPGPSLRRAQFEALLMALLPAAGMLGALAAVMLRDYRAAAGSLLAGILLANLIRVRRAGVLGHRIEAVTSGPLRDHVFAFAAQVKVRVDQLFVMAASDSRLSNAFALQGRQVVLTDTLLAQLSPRQITAVMAHELAHLRHHHPRLLSLAAVAPNMVVCGLLSWTGPWLFTAVGAVSMASFVLLSRHFEYVADREAVRMTNDPEALVTALVVISHANGMPVRWSTWTGLPLTHPSVAQRADALVRAGLMTEVQAGLALSRPLADPERWPWAMSASEPITGTTARTQGSQALGWISGSACTLVLALLVSAARVWLRGEHTPLVVIAGAIVGALLMLALFDRGAVANYRRWRTPLTQKLQPGPDAIYAGLAPGHEPRLYEGYSDWDVGFVEADARGLRYRGERAAFAVAAADLVGMERVSGLAGWFASPRLQVRCRDARGQSQCFTLRDASAARMAHLAASCAALEARLQTALAQTAGSQAEPLPSGALPDATQITSEDPGRATGWSSLAGMVVPIAMLSIAAGLLTGLPFVPAWGPGVLEVFLASMGALVLVRLPYLLPRRAATR